MAAARARRRVRRGEADVGRTSGGRVGLGYGAVVTTAGAAHVKVVREGRAVLGRTWGYPRDAEPHVSFVGVGLRASLGLPLVSLGAYRQLAAVRHDRTFLGIHVGFGA